MAQTITIAELKTWDKEMLLPSEVAAVTGMDPQWLRDAPQLRPEWVPFPFVLTPFRNGSGKCRVRFPRLALIRWMEGHGLEKKGA